MHQLCIKLHLDSARESDAAIEFFINIIFAFLHLQGEAHKVLQSDSTQIIDLRRLTCGSQPFNTKI